MPTPRLQLLNTATAKWRDPGSTNPRGHLAVDVGRHPYGGLVELTDDNGQGLAVGLLGVPAARNWPAGTPIQGMPLRVDDEGNVWAPPYPIGRSAQQATPGLAIGSPTGTADEVAPLTAPVTLTLTNDTAYPMLALRRVAIRDARLNRPRKPVSYGLIIDGQTAAPWPLFTGSPDHETSIIVSTATATIDGVPGTTYVTGVDDIVSVNPVEHVYSGSVALPYVIVDPGDTVEFAVSTCLIFQENETAPFEVRVGDTTVEILAWSVVDPNFGTEV